MFEGAIVVATALLTILPLRAGAQTEVHSPAFEDSGFDRTHRRRVLDQCQLLREVRSWTAFDVVAGLPTALMDGMSGGFSTGFDRGETFSMLSSDRRSLFPSLRSCSFTDASAHPSDDLVAQIFSREEKYFARFQESALPLDEALTDLDTGDFMRDQSRVLFDAGRRFYLGSYGTRLRGYDTIDVAWWNPVDFVVAPALLSGYAFLFGWETKFKLLGMAGTFELEPLRRILDRQVESQDGWVSAAGIEFDVGRLPVKAIVSMGIRDGDPLIDFVGIGTSLGKARQVARHASAADRK